MSSAPRPVTAANISAVMMPMRARPTARRTPAMMKGRDAGMMILVNIFPSPAPYARPTSTSPALTVRTPLKVFIKTGKTPLNKTTGQLRGGAEADPEDKARNHRDARRRVERVDERVEDVFREAVAPHEQAEDDADDERAREADEVNLQAVERLLRELAGGEKLDGRARDRAGIRT